MKVVNVVGARPQFIKYFPVLSAIRNPLSGVDDVLVHTGQHYDYSMSKVFFDEFGVKEPEYHLEAGSASHGAQTGVILKKCEEVFLKERPDAVIVYGDTNSTLGAALAAAKIHIPVTHIEAGLRSFNKNMPEEVNRILTDHISTLLFCPGKEAIKNLQAEGFRNVFNDGEIADNTDGLKAGINFPVILNVGDVMYDVLLHAVKIASSRSNILEKLSLSSGEYSVLTIHRAESTDDSAVFSGLVDFVNEVSNGKKVVFPMHPRTRKAFEKSDKKFGNNIMIIEPLGYFDILMLLKNSALVMTDSGGMQKEAYWLQVPCITLRDRTEWVETVDSGWNILYKDFKGPHKPKADGALKYGDGKAAERIIAAVAKLNERTAV